MKSEIRKFKDGHVVLQFEIDGCKQQMFFRTIEEAQFYLREIHRGEERRAEKEREEQRLKREREMIIWEFEIKEENPQEQMKNEERELSSVFDEYFKNEKETF